MQKVVKFLEAYVQWVALGLGLLWVLWMGYSYWAVDPVVATINNEKVTPGDVEQKLMSSTPVDGLDRAAQNQGPYPQEIHDLFNDHTGSAVIKQFTDQVASARAPESWYSPFTGGVPQEFHPSNPEGPTAGEGTIPDIKGSFALETGANGVAVQTGMSVVNRPDPTVPVIDPRNVPAGAPQQQLLTPPDVTLIPAGPNGAQPAVNPAAPNQQPNAPKPIAIVPEEVTWVTVSATLDMKKLAEAFQKAQIPASAPFTAVLRVELLRQELQPNGNWTAEETVKDLTNQFKPPFPGDAKAGPNLQAAYLAWAQQHVADIVEPGFYDVLRGQTWKTAAMPDLADVNNPNNVQNATFDPSTIKPGQVSTLPPDQRAIWYKWNQDQEKQKAQQHRPKPSATPTGGGYPRGGAMGEPFFYPAPPPPSGTAGPDPAMIERMRQEGQRRAQQQRPPTPPPTYRQPQVTGDPTAGGEIPFTGGAQPNRGPTAQDLPPSPFSPAQQTRDLEVWAHDETTLPGKIYRYKLRIYLKNPMWGTQGMAKNPDDATIFALEAETDWTKPMPSPSKRDFFVTNGGSVIGGIPKIGVDYFQWEDGQWKQTPLSVQPGDRVGQTSWTVADIRPVGSSNDNRVLLVSDTGDLTSRYYKTDKARKEYQDLLNKVKAATPPPAPGTPGGPGFGAAVTGSGEVPFTAPGGARGGH